MSSREACEHCSRLSVYGVNGNGDGLCTPCLVSEYNYAALHVPESIAGVTLSEYLVECEGRL